MKIKTTNKGELIEKRRIDEKVKYFDLQVLMPEYGSSNHGADASEYVANKKPNLVVDFGCGQNNFINNLKELGINGIGIDFVYEEADIIAPMHEVPLEDNSADFITAFDSLEHLIPEDVDLVLNEMARIAKPKADFCFSISYQPSSILVHGQNLHPTTQSDYWWMQKISTRGQIKDMGKYRIGNFK